MRDMIHDKYNKIIDNVYNICYGLSIKMNVLLAKKQADGKRYSYHHEYEYRMGRYNVQNLRTIKREFDYFLSIEINNPYDMIKDSIRIYPQDIMPIRTQLQNLYSKFYNYFNNNIGDQYGSLAIKNQIIDLVALELEKDNGEIYNGIRMYFPDYGTYFDVSLERFSGLAYTFQCINMYEAAQNMINYIGYPEYGYNLTNYTNNNHMEELHEEQKEIEGIKGNIVNNRVRTINQSNKSIFDIVDSI